MADPHTPDTPEDRRALLTAAIDHGPKTILAGPLADLVVRELQNGLWWLANVAGIGGNGETVDITFKGTWGDRALAVLSLPERDTAEPALAGGVREIKPGARVLEFNDGQWIDTDLVERVAEKLRGYQWHVGPNTRESITRGMDRVHLTGGERHAVALAAVQALTEAGPVRAAEEFEPGQPVEWNRAGDQWEPATVFRVGKEKRGPFVGIEFEGGDWIDTDPSRLRSLGHIDSREEDL